MMKKRGPDEMGSGQELIQIGDVLQQKGTESLERTLAKVQQTIAIADDITLELHRQLEQLDNTTKVVKDTRSDIKKANEYIRYFAKQLYTDKFIMCLIILCMIACLAIIVLKVGGVITAGSDDDTDATDADDTDSGNIDQIPQ